ncbi:hypothetical protein PENSTE_c006G09925 [Penicillium steckii]|uniref:Uncharacterized protein n=1 Tax=Penicillium steckii TaxID=303698 RepID=A0A1V6TGS7_9EURO|nr:hypothetical protein PENSTE_c006G09925 [Penicillium steckii]
MNTSNPLFVAQEALCFYPISTIYDSCPRYLYYALLFVSICTRWTGWLFLTLLSTASVYAGTAAIEAFILVSSPQKFAKPSTVTIPYISDNTSLHNDFPQIVTGTTSVDISPGALELDGDAVLAIVVTGYLVFLPLQCYSRVLTQERARNLLFGLWNLLMLAGGISALIYSKQRSKTPLQYMFCYPEIPPLDQTSSDGWQSSWRNSTWNESVWNTFSDINQWGSIGDICFNPCFNSSQILRQSTSLQAWVASADDELDHPHRFIDKIIYSKRYIYSLVGISVLFNFVHLIFRWLPYKSHISSKNINVIWRERKIMYDNIKTDLIDTFSTCKAELENEKDTCTTTTTTSTGEKSSSFWKRLRPALTRRYMNVLIHVLADSLILLGILLSMIISPLAIIAFVIWIEWWIHNDGPSQEHPQQVGQWSYLVGIALLMVSAAILALKHRIASDSELENEISRTSETLAKLIRMREARTQTEIEPLASTPENEGRAIP